MKLFCLNITDTISLFALLISIFALASTLRKKEFGAFFYVPLIEESLKNDIWLKLIKSDVYKINILIEDKIQKQYRLATNCPNTEKDSVIAFLDSSNNNCQVGHLKSNTILKFTNCTSSKISITYYDKYDNRYTQSLVKGVLSKRCHTNFYNLTFVGS